MDEEKEIIEQTSEDINDEKADEQNKEILDEQDEQREEDEILLGNRIRLSGFKQSPPGTMLIAKKIIGNYIKKIEDSVKKIDSISIVLKSVHGENSKSNIKIKAVSEGKILTSEVVEFNVFIALSKAFDKIINEIEHAH